MSDENKIKQLKNILDNAKQIAVVSHVNPDGDAIGSGIAWTAILKKKGYNAQFIVPNNYPEFLNWMKGIDEVNVYKNNPEKYNRYIQDADLVFCMDFNQIARIEQLGVEIQKNKSAKKILIDHHLMPSNECELMFSDTTTSSTALLTYYIIEACGWEEDIDYNIAEAMYVGISTDTGNFTFGNLNPPLFNAVAKLVEKGIKPEKLNIQIYNNHSVERMRLMGYMLNEKMNIVKKHNAAYMTLEKNEQNKFAFQPGDSEGFVNLPLTINQIKITAFFLETKECIKVSLRSQGELDMNDLARKYFNGGGHKNASGGKFFGTMKEAVNVFKKALDAEYKTN